MRPEFHLETPHRWRVRICGMLIILVGLAAYSNSFSGPFIFDDAHAIVENRSVSSGVSLKDILYGQTPVVLLSLRLNYLLGGWRVWGYHAFNLTIHILAALTLMGIVRRALLSKRLGGRLAPRATFLSAAVAMLWMLHPIQTESVTYIIDRKECLMGLLYLVTLYTFIRGHESRRRFWWHFAAVVACVMGMRTKQVMATAPLMVLLYDRTFLSGLFRQAIRSNWRVYLLLAISWGVLLQGSAERIQKEGFGIQGLSSFDYAKTQFGVVLHYLHLSVWPHPLCLDYAWPVSRSWNEIVLPAMVIVGLVGLTVWAIVRMPAWGFLGAWFFLILAPTSSVIVITQLAFEHRMYLSLAAVAAVATVGGYLLGRRVLSALVFSRENRRRLGQAIGYTTVALLAVTSGCLTFARNADYRSELAIWQDTVEKKPDNPRAHNNLGYSLGILGRHGEAMAQQEEALRLKPDYPEAHNNLGESLSALGKHAEAITHYHEALRLRPDFLKAHNNLCNSLHALGRYAEAIAYCEEALRLKPDCAEAHNNLGYQPNPEFLQQLQLKRKDAQ